MENVTRALLLAGSAILFVIGFSYSMFLITKLSTTSREVFSTVTTTRYYDNIEANDSSERIVGIDTVISTIYRYYKEGYSVKIIDKDNEVIQLFDTSVENEARKRNLDSTTIYCNSSKRAYMFNAPWVASTDYAMNRINYFLNGTKGYINNALVDYSKTSPAFSGKDGGFLEIYGNAKFEESFTEYRYSGETISTEEGIESITGNTQEKNRILITYKVTD